MAEYGLSVNIPRMKADLKKYGIEYDQWFLESELHNSGYVEETVQLLTDKGWTYEKDGALWLNTTQLLKEKFMREGKSQEQVDKLDLKDDVLCRANGFYTYFAADIAYHRNKLEVRGFDKAINIWGADHHGHVARLQAALDGLGLDGSHRLVVVLMQLVNLMQDGKPVRMSKRSGKAIALHDLLDEICSGRGPVLLQLPGQPPAPWTLTWTWRCGRTARTRCTMSSMPTPASAPWCPGWRRRGRRSPPLRGWTPVC